MASYLEKYEQLRARSRGNLLDTLGIQLVEASESRVVAQLAFQAPIATGSGAGFHGAALMALADHAAGIACGYAVNPTMEEGAPPVLTVQLQRPSFAQCATRDHYGRGAGCLHRGRTMLRGRNAGAG